MFRPDHGGDRRNLVRGGHCRGGITAPRTELGPDGGAHVRVKATIPVGRQPFRIAADPRTNTIYLTNDGSDTVSVISGRTNAVTAAIRVGRFPVGIAADPRTGRIYVTQDSNKVPLSAGGRTP